MQIAPVVETPENAGETIPPAGFRINYNFNTQQLREIEVIFVSDHRRFGALQRGDILLQINGLNCDSMSEKELNRYLVNSSNPRPPSHDLIITQVVIYRPYVPGLVDAEIQAAATTNGTATTDESEAATVDKTLSSSSSSSSALVENNTTANNESVVEEIRLIKNNGAMGLSIVGGGNVACHPFGVDKPGIFISKIVPDGPAARTTSLRVGDRLLKVCIVLYYLSFYDNSIF